VRLVGRYVICLAFGALSAGLAPTLARAAFISPNPLTVPAGSSDPPLTGSVELVGIVNGVPTGGVVTRGTVEAGDWTFVFRVEVTAGVSDALVMGIGPPNVPSPPIGWLPMDGMGWIPGAGVDIAFTGPSNPNPPIVAFTPAGGGVSAGQSYDLVFVSFETHPAQDGSLVVHAGLSIVPPAFGTAVILPEPGTAVLLGLGLALLGRSRATAGGRRRGRAFGR
jgi:hypothetical protein